MDDEERPHGSPPHHGDPTVRDLDSAGLVAHGLRCRQLSFQFALHCAVANSGLGSQQGVLRRASHLVGPNGSSGTTKWYNGISPLILPPIANCKKAALIIRISREVSDGIRTHDRLDHNQIERVRLSRQPWNLRDLLDLSWPEFFSS